MHRREDDLVLLLNSYLKLFSGKLHPRWSNPFKMIKFYQFGVIEIGMDATDALKVNGSQLNSYIIVSDSRGRSLVPSLMLLLLRGPPMVKLGT